MAGNPCLPRLLRQSGSANRLLGVPGWQEMCNAAKTVHTAVDYSGNPSSTSTAHVHGMLSPCLTPVRAVLLDAAGTLLVPSESTAGVYLRYASKYGVRLTEQEVLARFRR